MNLHYRVKHLMGWDDSRVNLWFVTKNPLLGNISPDQMILANRYDRLKKFIDEAERASL